MQWLIDIILALIDETDIYIDRGDAPGADFAIGDFVRDNTFRDLDLSAIVPANVTAVVFRIILRSTSAGKNIYFRTNGNVNTGNIAPVYPPIANLYYGTQCTVYPDSNRIIEYRISSTDINEIYMTICGWWLKRN